MPTAYGQVRESACQQSRTTGYIQRGVIRDCLGLSHNMLESCLVADRLRLRKGLGLACELVKNAALMGVHRHLSYPKTWLGSE